MLLRECAAGGVTRWQPCSVHAVRHGDAGFQLDTDRGTVSGGQIVIATGGLSIPKIGATDFGYRVARQFGHSIQETRPALVPLTFDSATWAPFATLSGLSLEACVEAGTGKSQGTFMEDLLFTHRGLSGPAVLQISSFWRAGMPLRIDLAPGHDLGAELRAAKHNSRRLLRNELSELIPRRLADTWLAASPEVADKPLSDQRDRDLAQLAGGLHQWELKPQGSEGYRKAEATAGGVDTRELSSQTLQSRRVPGLFFIGEVVDVTGWLGGYNFQWAWASAASCAAALTPLHHRPSAGYNRGLC
jgi:predicted Rossmann fold flavoprotein